jgi:hypothetical protein
MAREDGRVYRYTKKQEATYLTRTKNLSLSYESYTNRRRDEVVSPK